MNLCLPYASVYMLALGMNDVQVGIVASVYMLMQVVFAFLGGPITDKLGRRLSTAIFDFTAWSLPCVIWCFAQNFWAFIIAALLNGTMKITQNSWDCLLVEDAEREQIPDIYSLVISAGQLSALFAPISAILVSRYSLVFAVRILYANAFIIMTAKLIILYICSRETRTGMVRMAETKGKSLFSQVPGYAGVLRLMLKSKGTLFAILISALVSIVGMINTSFWQIIVNKRIGVPDSFLPLFPMFRSIISMIFLFTLIPWLTHKGLKHPLRYGFASYFIGQLLLILTPLQGDFRYPVLLVSCVFDAFGSGALAMMAESLVALHVDEAERARVLSILMMIIMLVSTPFGWIAGLLSETARWLPFALNLILLATGWTAGTLFYRK
ncbi:MAG: MFS transporter [Spirochaetaceae bacterium]|nr:MFS transporter [Spirochaetaceae bacterium]